MSQNHRYYIILYELAYSCLSSIIPMLILPLYTVMNVSPHPIGNCVCGICLTTNPDKWIVPTDSQNLISADISAQLSQLVSNFLLTVMWSLDIDRDIFSWDENIKEHANAFIWGNLGNFQLITQSVPHFHYIKQNLPTMPQGPILQMLYDFMTQM